MECSNNILRLLQRIVPGWWSRLDAPGDAKINEDDLGWICWGGKHILGLNIPVNETVFVYMLQGGKLRQISTTCNVDEDRESIA